MLRLAIFVELREGDGTQGNRGEGGQEGKVEGGHDQGQVVADFVDVFCGTSGQSEYGFG